jgi:Electron transfer DM13
MKVTYLFLVVLTSSLTISTQASLSANQISKNSPLPSPQSLVAQASPHRLKQSNSLASGRFISVEKPTQGTFRVVTENRQRYLELDQTFKTNNGPDLYVILHRNDAPPKSGLREQDYVTLGRLQKVSGAQRYAIPANVNLASFRSAAIWCRRFNSTFGYGKLGS